jgi:hypothetical protein
MHWLQTTQMKNPKKMRSQNNQHDQMRELQVATRMTAALS